MPVAVVLIWGIWDSSPLELCPLVTLSTHRDLLLPLLLLFATSPLMTSKRSQLISPAASWHSCPVVVLLLAVQPLASYLENKTFRLGGYCICVYINMFLDMCVYIYIGCWLLKAVTHFSAFYFYLPSLSLFYCMTLIFTISFRLNSMCLAGLPVLLCLTSSSLEIYVLVTNELHLRIIPLLNQPLIKIPGSCTFVGLEESLVPHFWAVWGFLTCLGANIRGFYKPCLCSFVLTLRRLQLGDLIFVIILRLIRRTHDCAMSEACSRCVLVHVLHINYVTEVKYGLCWRQNIPVTLRWENWNAERMGKARSVQLRDGNSQIQRHSKCLGSHWRLSPAAGSCARGE